MVRRLSNRAATEFAEPTPATHASVPCGSLSLRERVRVRGSDRLTATRCCISRQLSASQISVRKQQATTHSPELVESDGDGHNDHDDGKIPVHAPAAIGNFQQISQAAFSVGPNFGENDPGPAHAIGAAQVVPDVRLGHREQNVAHQLPLARALRDRDIEIGCGHIGHGLDHQRQERHEINDEQKRDLLDFRGAEPRNAQRYENDRGNVGADERDRVEEGGDGRKRCHVNPQRDRHNHCEPKAERDAFDGRERVAHQRLVEVQRRKRLQHFQGAGQDGHIDQPVLETFAAGEEPPRQQDQRDKETGERKFIAVWKLLADPQAGQPHNDGEQPDEQHREKKEAEHGYQMEYWGGGGMECWSVGVLECWNAHFNSVTPTLQHSIPRSGYSFSSGKTLTSTRRFFLLWSGLLGSVIPANGLSQPLPMTLNLFWSNLYFPRIALRTASARS